MRKSVYTRQYRLLLELLIEARKSKKLTQTQIAKKLGRYQSFLAKVENGERRLDVVELIALARAIGTDPVKLFAKIVEIS